MKNILVVCPAQRDLRELSLDYVNSGYNLIFHTYDNSLLERIICKGIGWMTETFDPAAVIDEMLAVCERENIEGIVTSEDYPGSIFASIIAQKAGFPAPLPEHVLLFQHKYYSRLAQLKHVPEATPDFMLGDPHRFDPLLFDLAFPVFLKPVKSYFSVFANSATTIGELLHLMKTSVLPPEFLHQFNWFMSRYTPYDLSANYLLIENSLQGVQVTLEGFVHNGTVEPICIVDSIMFPGTISFKRFEYPSSLPVSVQVRMNDIASRLMCGVGFDNGFFNIEFMYNPEADTIHIIEVNPRMISQFADLVEKVDGVNTYAHLLALATGKRPDVPKRKGMHGMAASFVLRVFEDKKVIKAPSQEQLEQVYQLFPDARIQLYVQEGDKLSDAFQDGKSFRYGLVHLGGRDRKDLFAKFEQCKRRLDFQFAPVHSSLF